MENGPQISDAERLVLGVLWKLKSATANEVIAELEGQTAWSPATIRTLLSRLVKKEAVEFRRVDRAYRYTSTISKEAYRGEARRSFVRRIYGGAVAPMLSQFIREEALTPEEIDELQSLLDEKDGR